MSGLLRMIDDFVNRMIDPSYGTLVNEEYSLRVGEILSDEATTVVLSSEAARLRAAEELSLNTWTWLLGGVSQQRLSEALLLDLCRTFQDPSFQVLVIEYALTEVLGQDPELSLPIHEDPSIETIDNPWLRELVSEVVFAPVFPQDGLVVADNIERNNDLALRVRRSQNLLVALLTVNRGECLVASTSLLHHQWEGQDELRRYFLSCLAVMDEEPRNYWLSLAPRLP